MVILVRIEGGPHLGLAPVESPLQSTISLGVNEHLEPDNGNNPHAYAIYDLIRQGDELFYVFSAYSPSRPDRRIESASDSAIRHEVDEMDPIERRIEDAIKNFYENPNYDIYTTRPTDEHEQTFVQVGHRRALVDVGIAALIRELFRLQMDTIGSCQGRPKGEALEAYVAFVRERDARRFYDLLTNSGIGATGKSTKLKIRTGPTVDGRPMDEIEVSGGNVMFPSSEIDRIARLLQAEASDP